MPHTAKRQRTESLETDLESLPDNENIKCSKTGIKTGKKNDINAMPFSYLIILGINYRITLLSN